MKSESWRWQVLKHWLAGRRNGAGFFEMLGVVCDPTLGRRARQFIGKLEDAPPYWLVHIRGIGRPLFFPQALGRFCLDMLIVEQFETKNWHYYQIEPTKLRSDDVVMDAGAAEGLFSLQAHVVARKVYAAEPSPMWVEALRETFSNAANVELLPFALSDSNRSVRLTAGDLNSTVANGGQGLTVDARTIDSLFAEQNRPLTYLKGDLEGAEIEVLRGAEKTIRAWAPRIAITTYHQADHAEQIAAILRRLIPRYQILVKGIEHRAGAPVMLHAWVEGRA